MNGTVKLLNSEDCCKVASGDLGAIVVKILRRVTLFVHVDLYVVTYFPLMKDVVEFQVGVPSAEIHQLADFVVESLCVRNRIQIKSALSIQCLKSQRSNHCTLCTPQNHKVPLSS